jgi:8-oxo-dGTP pyrophosphatase MutT (NUDIX family)
VKARVEAAVALVMYERKVLLLLRGLTAPWAPGKWALPGGNLAPGETPLTGLLRELYEETSLMPPLFVVGPLRHPNPKHAFFVIGSTTDKVRLLDGEHDEYRWVDPRQLPCYDLAPGAGNLIERGLSWGNTSQRS